MMKSWGNTLPIGWMYAIKESKIRLLRTWMWCTIRSFLFLRESITFWIKIMESKVILLSGYQKFSLKMSKLSLLLTEIQNPWNISTNLNVIKSWFLLMWESWDLWSKTILRRICVLKEPLKINCNLKLNKIQKNLKLLAFMWKYIWTVFFLKKESLMSYQKSPSKVYKAALKKLIKNKLKKSAMLMKCLALSLISGAKIFFPTKNNSNN